MWQCIGDMWIWETQERHDVVAEGTDGCYYVLHPAVYEEGSGPAYALIQHWPEADREVVAVWYSPGGPDYYNQEWFDEFPEAEQVLDMVTEDMSGYMARERWNTPDFLKR